MRPGHEAGEPVQSGHSGHSRRVRPEEQLARWGRWQHRQVTTKQLREVGWDATVVYKRVRQGRLHPVYAEVYSLGGPPRTRQERWMAAVLTFGPGAVLSHSAAAELYELLRFPLHELHVITRTERKPRDRIVPHHRSRGVPWRYVDHLPVTSPELTILDCATTVRNDKAYRRIVRQAQAGDLTTHARLVAFAAMRRGTRGVARMNRELAEGPSRTRSANEDEVLDVFRRGGTPEPNAVVFGEEVDLWFPRLNVAIEVQSALHDNPTAYADDVAKKERFERRGVRVLWVR